MSATRREKDTLGELAVPAGARHGVHTARALENFPLLGRAVHPALIRAFGAVKLAALRTNRNLGFFPDPARADALERACRELMDGLLDADIAVDALQGGAGTSTNMNVNEVLANRALELLGLPRGDYGTVSPLDHVNLHQSTNDTFPTALRIAAIRGLRELERQVLALQEAFQAQEKAMAHVVKVARTELQDAVLTTLGRSMGAYAEALNRDRWRLAKAEERLRVVNLGGTAIGTGLAAPTDYIFRVVDELRELTGMGLARAENLVEATQNLDALVEVSGLLKALATTLIKISTDLRVLSSGPEAGLGELRLPPRQAGSSIMPGKVNPVIPEAATQAAILAIAHDQALSTAAAMGSLELNPFLPLAAHSLLESFDLLARACGILRAHCVEGMTADEDRCRSQVVNGTAAATALLPLLGYERVSDLVARAAGRGLRAAGIEEGFFTAAQFDELTSPEAVGRLGFRKPRP
ncbi:aspartate ammonia-lyase [Mesoterricola silvestris]|uniref:Aspartate ammonia-lyase n=1 Tax=Mesoterricola silvestris TaxID=2927979 RepID=A0AA48GX74_9BACT|nr:aspartate ammonia-lyase [Mesoterricola silvestris]BDU73531.1 aspartate ammonia-lyase [Mesoterricola silvestris]